MKYLKKYNESNDPDIFEEVREFLQNIVDEIPDDVNIQITQFGGHDKGSEGFNAILYANIIEYPGGHTIRGKFEITNCKDSILQFIKYMFSIGYKLNNISMRGHVDNKTLGGFSQSIWKSKDSGKPDIEEISDKLKDISKINIIIMEFKEI